MALFKRGFKAVDEEKKRQEKNRENKGKGLFKFFLSKDGDEADITFLTEEPINYYAHNIKTYVDGKERFNEVPCIGDNCPHCKNGEKTTFKSAWLVIDHRPYSYTDKEGKVQEGQDQIRLFIYGTKIASQLDRVSQKYGLSRRLMTMVRLGKGTSTSYTFERGDKQVFSDSEIEELLPDALRKDFDGTEESLYTILEKQILMMAGVDDEEEEEEDEDDRSSLVSLDDEEEERPTKKATKKFGSSKTKKLGKRENSIKKTSVKKLLKK